MNRNIVSLLTWVGPQVLIAVAVFFAADSAARYQENQDLQKQSQIWASYVSQPELKMTEIAVAVHGGEAVLTGSVTSPGERALAEKIALAIDGIKHVDNRLEVAARSTQRGRVVQHALAFVAGARRGAMTGTIV
ncbi:MAG TPA: BON domain-containing protein [Nevskiaceae bacterium]|nr:BON domain-containing protein [Nevskiaceae bacterium]